MRHIYIRSILSLIWLAAAMISAITNNLEMSLFYALLCAVFGYSALASWKKEKEEGKGK
ncbi:MAG: hypothetical protein HFI30_06695 [Lachnospiraceae bacterium]|jgi:hypothetical protein|nr:hypothetical protein [Lachnospiraceae bacterium]MCI8995363.1 hypothetical protein [Lachnospiraceae bacterium]